MRIVLVALAAALGLITSPAAWAASGVTGVQIISQESADSFSGVAYVRTRGVVSGVVEAGEAVENLAGVIKPGAASYPYTAQFEIIAPAAGQAPAQVVVFDSENRGGPISLKYLDGFLQRHHTAYARVQWQTGYAKDVPANAQGIGLVIVRDFARWLAGRAPEAKIAGGAAPPAFSKLILTGISQSGWFVNTFIDEGFNEDPITKERVFDAAVAVDGGGAWLAINQRGARAGAPQSPYVIKDFIPMRRAALMRRPMSDPLYIDVVNYTDFYRLRAGLTSLFISNARFHRYEFPTPHAQGGGPSPAECNGGKPMDTNPMTYAPYYRALILNLEKAVGADAPGAKPLPASMVFGLAGAPEASGGFNALPDVRVPVPSVDRNGYPFGGVRFAEADNPLGSPSPVVVPPALTDSIDHTCANRGGWTAFDKAKLTELYGSKANYVKLYTASVERLIGEGWLLEEDKAAMIAAAQKAYIGR